jgi:hypothetical protein
MSEVILKLCSCVSKYQDEKYGAGIRVFNKSQDGAKLSCSVCGKPLNIGGKK